MEWPPYADALGRNWIEFGRANAMGRFTED